MSNMKEFSIEQSNSLIVANTANKAKNPYMYMEADREPTDTWTG